MRNRVWGAAAGPMERYRRPVVYGFFALFLLVGISLYGDYGISSDEAISRENGFISLRYVAETLNPAYLTHHPDVAAFPRLRDWLDRDYGVLFELPAAWLEQVLHLTDPGDQYRFRHLLTFLVCFTGVIAVYQLGTRRFADWRLGLLGAAWLVCSPRLFADFFYNDKDAVFMAFFAIAMNTGVRWLLRPTWGRTAWHALACAAAIDVRIMGIVLPAVTLGLLGLRIWRGEVGRRPSLPAVALYVVLLVGFTIGLWPYLWEHSIPNFKQALENMSNFRWDSVVLYRGEEIKATQLPWHYPLVWMGITTPLLYLGMLLVGIRAVANRVMGRHGLFWRGADELQDVLFLVLLVGPVLAVILLHSVLYDGWRQLYFVYPAFLLLALRGWVVAWRWRPAWLAGFRRFWPAGLAALTAVSMLVVVGRMVRAHPNEQVYFNALAGPHASLAERYEMDYWGLSFRQGLEYIARHDKRPHIKVFDAIGSPVWLNVYMLSPADRKRIEIVYSGEGADYLITNYRWRPKPFALPHEVYRHEVEGLRVQSVFLLHW